jgi:hypothetical protein
MTRLSNTQKMIRIDLKIGEYPFHFSSFAMLGAVVQVVSRCHIQDLCRIMCGGGVQDLPLNYPAIYLQSTMPQGHILGFCRTARLRKQPLSILVKPFKSNGTRVIPLHGSLYAAIGSSTPRDNPCLVGIPQCTCNILGF